jgi:precorrin-2/cobalt-factor-2 C20-methyltransferase
MTTSNGRLTGVGVGPGDPMLLTRQAVDVLGSVDRIVAPTTGPADPGRAETIVRDALGEVEITRLPFDMTPDGAGGEEARARSHRAAAAQLLDTLGAGQHVAFVTLGDPNLYSTFPSLVAALRQLGWRGEVDTVAGITAFQALAARTGTVLLDGTESLALVTALDGPAHLAEALEDPARAVVVYKGGRHLPAIAQLLAQHGRLEGAVFGERLGLEGERVGPLVEMSEEPAAYLATVIVPPAAHKTGT